MQQIQYMIQLRRQHNVGHYRARERGLNIDPKPTAQYTKEVTRERNVVSLSGRNKRTKEKKNLLPRLIP